MCVDVSFVFDVCVCVCVVVQPVVTNWTAFRHFINDETVTQQAHEQLLPKPATTHKQALRSRREKDVMNDELVAQTKVKMWDELNEHEQHQWVRAFCMS